MAKLKIYDILNHYPYARRSRSFSSAISLRPARCCTIASEKGARLKAVREIVDKLVNLVLRDAVDGLLDVRTVFQFALLGRPRGRGDWRGGGRGGGQCRVLGTRDTYSAEQIDTMHVTASNDHMEEARPQQK
jgi:hypothetical protein